MRYFGGTPDMKGSIGSINGFRTMILRDPRPDGDGAEQKNSDDHLKHTWFPFHGLEAQIKAV
jgi:hypothetical protein